MKMCEFEGCNKKVHGKGYCHKHWQHLYRHGRLFEHTRYDPPKIEIEGETAYLPLYNNKGDKIIDVLIDASEVEWTKNYKWYRGGKNHVLNKGIGSLARAIMKAAPGEIVDHINRNTFDNRRINLRIATRSINVHNSKVPATNTSGVKGVCYHKQSGGWEGFIQIEGERIRKLYRNKEDAIQFRKELEKQYLTFS
jgi:hypothetical protein